MCVCLYSIFIINKNPFSTVSESEKKTFSTFSFFYVCDLHHRNRNHTRIHNHIHNHIPYAPKERHSVSQTDYEAVLDGTYSPTQATDDDPLHPNGLRK